MKITNLSPLRGFYTLYNFRTRDLGPTDPNLESRLCTNVTLQPVSLEERRRPLLLSGTKSFIFLIYLIGMFCLVMDRVFLTKSFIITIMIFVLLIIFCPPKRRVSVVILVIRFITYTYIRITNVYIIYTYSYVYKIHKYICV